MQGAQELDDALDFLVVQKISVLVLERTLRDVLLQGIHTVQRSLLRSIFKGSALFSQAGRLEKAAVKDLIPAKGNTKPLLELLCTCVHIYLPCRPMPLMSVWFRITRKTTEC